MKNRQNMEKIPRKLGEILVEGGIVTKHQLQKALDIQKKEKKLLGEIIVELGYVTKDNLELALVRQFGSLLGEILLENKLITFEELQIGLRNQRETNRPLGEVLIDLKYITEDQLLQALAVKYKLPYVNLAEYKINMDALSKVPRRICRTANVLPIDMREGYVVVATATPEDIITEQNIKTITGMNVRLVIASSREIKKRVLP